jgi:excisionase family DNA binding protein
MGSALHPPDTTALLDYPASQRYLGGVSRSTLKALVGRNELAVVRIGRRTLFRRADLDRFIQQLAK